ncbi:MAG: hypothetical protein M3Y06_09865 [Actinomycetota bacterium]|nr:hypothetical protein [Actinomycetota bacterium]
MRNTGVVRFDRTLRVVMWMDGFLSVGLVVVGMIATPIVATIGVPKRLQFSLAITSIGCAVLLAAFGAITAVVLMVRMQAGQYFLPVDLRLPLPGPMRPSMPVSPTTAEAAVVRPEATPHNTIRAGR